MAATRLVVKRMLENFLLIIELSPVILLSDFVKYLNNSCFIFSNFNSIHNKEWLVLHFKPNLKVRFAGKF